MSTRRKLLSGSSGLNTVADRTRVQYDWRTGISDLAVAINVSISPTGRINRRDGKTLRTSISAPHSLFCDGGETIFVSDSALYLFESNYLYRKLASLTNNNCMACSSVGKKIYYTNNIDLGYVKTGIANTWARTTNYVGPSTQRILSGPFAGNHLCWHGGRMYISKANVMWWSHYMVIDWYDMARNFTQFNTHIRMMKSVEGGMFVSTSRAIYFLKGLVPHEFVKNKVVNYPALEWSEATGYIDGTDVPELEVSGPCAMWVTREGAMLGTPDGNVKNLNKQKVVYPEGTKGRSLIKGLNFIHNIE